MWRSAKFVDDNVAFSRMPVEKELDEVVETFDAVVVLVEDFELPYSLDEWEKRGGRGISQSNPGFLGAFTRRTAQCPPVD